MKNILDLRAEITTQIDVYFKKDIHLDERLLQILEYSCHCVDGWMDSADVFSASVEYIPSLTNLFIRAGITEQKILDTTSRLQKIVSFRENIDAEPDIERTLQLVYQQYEFTIPNKFSQAYERVRKKGKISALDLIVGELESDLEGFGGGYINELTAKLLEAVGLNHTFWDTDNKQYISDLSDRIRSLDKIDQDIGDQQFILYWDGSGYRIKPFGTMGLHQFSHEPLKDGSLWIARGNVLQPVKRFRDEAFDELEFLINNDVAEKAFQDFFENHPEFLLALGGGKYINLHPQVVIHEDRDGWLIPDFLLEKVNDNMCDICDLKLATQAIMKYKRHRPGFRAAIHEAIAQLDYYRNWFEDKEHRSSFYTKTGLNAYKPKVVLIIGRSLDYYSDIERIQRESLIPSHVELVTYDDVFERAKVYRNIVGV